MTDNNKTSAATPKNEAVEAKSSSDDNVKLLDIALQKGSLEKEEIEKEKDKKVRFFRENFPGD